MEFSHVTWRKASYSNASGGNCVEVGVDWRKASFSNSSGGACVEVGVGSQLVAVRDSKDPDGPRLAFSAGAWDTFLTRVKHGRLDPA